MSTIYESYKKEIRRIRNKGNVLMKQIQQHETMMNHRKILHLPATFEDCWTLHLMVTKILQMLAIIDSYKYFQLENLPLVDELMDLFYQMTDNNYKIYLQSFMLKLRKLQSVDFYIQRNINC